MRDKGLVYEAIKFLKQQLDLGLIDVTWAGAVRTVLNAADEALSMQETFAPPAEDQNPFDYEARVAAAMQHAARWLNTTRADGGAIRALREAVALMHTELMRLRAAQQTEAEQPDKPLDAGLSPQLGLVYVSNHSTSRPAQADWLTHAKNPNHVSLLDLRVLEAHLATALGNVKAALNAQTGGY